MFALNMSQIDTWIQRINIRYIYPLTVDLLAEQLYNHHHLSDGSDKCPTELLLNQI